MAEEITAEGSNIVVATDPLAAPNTTNNDIPSVASDEATSRAEYDSPEQLLALLALLHEVDLTAETMDPLEWTFRKVVPIPKHYYWEVIQQESDLEHVPLRIKLWHKAVASMTGTYQWTEQKVGMPLARTLGLTSTRFSDVSMWMTEEDMRESKRIVSERQQKESMREVAGVKATTEGSHNAV